MEAIETFAILFTCFQKVSMALYDVQNYQFQSLYLYMCCGSNIYLMEQFSYVKCHVVGHSICQNIHDMYQETNSINTNTQAKFWQNI